MAIKLEDSGAKPKSSAGRRTTPLDTAFVKALIDAFQKQPYVEVDGENRPRLLGPDTEFKTKGKATSQGRRYQTELDTQGVKVRVTAIELKDNAGTTTAFKWRVYLPVSSENGSQES